MSCCTSSLFVHVRPDEAGTLAVIPPRLLVRDRRDSFPGGAAPATPDQIAVLALKVYELFLDAAPRSSTDTAAAIIAASRAF